jgi:membrane-bound lytic murein transglycosylase D
MRRLQAVLVTASLLLAGHLGRPGTVPAESALAPEAVQERALSASVEEPGAWRPDVSSGLAGDIDPAALSVKQPEWADSSAPRRPPAAPAAEPATVTAPRAAVVVPNPPAPPAKTGVKDYEVEDNAHVRQFVDLFQTGSRRAVVEGWLVMSGRYLPMVLDVFRQKGLPDELVFTAMIESGFNPVAASRAGAKGLWQFMAPTARRYGLRVDEWLDERLDPEKSTVAAARHLMDLYAVFGSWNLVQAAYNAGEMKVLQAIRAMGTSDFWALRSGPVLKDETKNFIPAIQAAALIAREPERYGFTVTPAEPVHYEMVTVPRSTSLKRLAEDSGIPLDALERLNLELKVKQTPPDGPYGLKVPLGSTAAVLAALERQSPGRPAAALARPTELRHGKALPHARVHVVKARETVRGIARQYGVPVGDLVRWNGLDAAARIRPGDRLRVAAVPTRDEGQGGSR